MKACDALPQEHNNCREEIVAVVSFPCANTSYNLGGLIMTIRGDDNIDHWE